jgi:hypothetical protein
MSLIERLLEHLPWYDPQAAVAREQRTERAARNARIVRRVAVAELHRLEHAATRSPRK